MNNVYILAKALVYAKTGNRAYADEVVSAINTINNSGTYGGPASLVECHEKRPNNWGLHCGASRIAVDLYIGDRGDLQRAADVFRGWLGERNVYSGFDFGDLSWQCDEGNPVGVNPVNCVKALTCVSPAISLNGAMPDDLRRGGGFQCPPVHTGYLWGAFEGAVVQAEMLYRAGYDAWNWGDRAMLRAANFAKTLDDRFGGWWAQGDDEWSPWVINHAYSTDFPANLPVRPGKNMGWTDWTMVRYYSKAQLSEGVILNFETDRNTLPPDLLVKMNLDAQSASIGYAKVLLKFDRNKLSVSGNVGIPVFFQRVIWKVSREIPIFINPQLNRQTKRVKWLLFWDCLPTTIRIHHRVLLI